MSVDLIILLAVFIAALVQSTLGFGFALISVPILGLFLPLHQAISVTFIIGTLINLFIFQAHRTHVDFSKIKYLLLCAVLGTSFAGIFLQQVKVHTIEFIVYLTILFMSLYMLSGLNIKIKNHQIAQVSTGFFAGIVNTLAAVSGPIVVLYLQNIGLKKREFLGSVSIILTALNVLSIILLLKLYGTEIFIDGWLLLIMAGFVPLTIYIGKRIITKINEQLFSRIVIISTLLIVLVKLAGMF